MNVHSMNITPLLFSVKGRIDRTTFWKAILPVSIAGFLFPHRFLLLVVLWMVIAIMAKRWHDLNKSGWWSLIALIPYIGPVWVLIELGLIPGSPDRNQYDLYHFEREDRFPYGQSHQTSQQSSPTNTPESLPEGFALLIAMLAKITKMDGIVCHDEIMIVDSFFHNTLKLSPELRKEAIRIFQQSKNDTVSEFEQHARRFYTIFRDHPQTLRWALEHLFSVALADGALRPEEEHLLELVMQIFGIETNSYAQYRSSRRSSEREVKDERYYAEILGLQGRYTHDDIRQAYRNRSLEYHPDKVAHLGEKIRQAAEEEMKRINEAYAFFRAHYHL